MNIEEKLIEIKRRIEKTNEVLMKASEKLAKIKTNNDLTARIVWLINDLSEKGDDRIHEISEAYYSILKTERDISRIQWRLLDYLETEHLDLYKLVQTNEV